MQSEESISGAGVGATEVVVHGSCVTRDCFNFDFTTQHFDLVQYYARTSIAAYCSDRVVIEERELTKLTSSFQRRQVMRDAGRDFLRDESPRDRLLVLDLIDERFHLVSCEGALLTRSVELLRSGWIEGRDSRVIRNGSPGHTARWQKGLQTFAKRLRVIAPARVVIHRAYWCEAYCDGEGGVHPFPEDEVAMAQAANAQLRVQYDELSHALGEPQNIDLFASGAVMASTEHRWGLTPFHYEDSYYAAAVEQLVAGAIA